jgi:hypothetical protein
MSKDYYVTTSKGVTMKAICRKRLSSATNFIDGKIYECYHEKDREYVGGRWVIDELGRPRFIIPDGSYSPHLTISYGSLITITKSSGCFELVDDSPSLELKKDSTQ